MVFLLKSGLPWDHIPHFIKSQDRIMIIENMKEKHDFASLTKDLPESLQRFGKVIQSLRFSEDPDYEKLKSILQNYIQEQDSTQS